MEKAQRKTWNQQQKTLRAALTRSDDHQKAIELFLSQHAMLHAAAMSQSGLWSFADEIWRDLSEEAARRIPPNGEHSIAWIIWHLARIEDVTMNLLVAGSPQRLHRVCASSCRGSLLDLTDRGEGNSPSLSHRVHSHLSSRR